MHKFPAKGQGKGQGPRPIQHEKYRTVLDELLPLLARKIDKMGGVMRIADLALHREVKLLLAQVPPRCPKTLPLIFVQWSNFFVNMADGLIGTALGYETGMINADGTLNQLYHSNFSMLNEVVDEQEIIEVREAKPMDLMDAADQLWQCALNLDNDAEFKAAYKVLEAARKNVRAAEGMATPSKSLQQNPNVQNPPRSGRHPRDGGPVIGEDERQTKKMQILHRIVELLERSPGQNKNMCLILMDPTIRELKRGVVSRFLQFLQEFPKLFRIVQVEGIPQYDITLLDNTVPDLRKPHSAAPGKAAPIEIPSNLESLARKPHWR